MKALDRSTVATPPAIVRRRSVVPVGMSVDMPIARSRVVGPVSRAFTAAVATATVCGTARRAVATNGA